MGSIRQLADTLRAKYNLPASEEAGSVVSRGLVDENNEMVLNATALGGDAGPDKTAARQQARALLGVPSAAEVVQLAGVNTRPRAFDPLDYGAVRLSLDGLNLLPGNWLARVGTGPVQATEAKQPTKVTRFTHFDGVNDLMKTVALAFGADGNFTVLASLRVTGAMPNGSSIITTRLNGDGSPSLDINNQLKPEFYYPGALITGPTLNPYETVTLAWRKRNEAIQAWVNGVSVGTATTNTPYPAEATFNSFGIYRGGTEQYFLKADVAKIAVFGEGVEDIAALVSAFDKSCEEGRWDHSINTPVLSPTQPWEQTWIQEMRPARLSDGKWVATYSGGATLNTQAVGFATSTDGETWIKRSTPIVGLGYGGHNAPAARSQLVAVTDTHFEVYFTDYIPGNWMRIVSRDGGATWGELAIVFNKNAAPSGYIGYTNSYIARDGNLWRLVIEYVADGPFYEAFTHTSTDRVNWGVGTKLLGLSIDGGSTSAGCWLKEDGVYHLFPHNSVGAGTNLPTDVYHYTSTDFINFTLRNMSFPRTRETGIGYFTNGIDQTADVRILPVDGTLYAYVTRCYNPDNKGNVSLSKFRGKAADLLA